jgi:cobalt/nickel transport system ATP-binding protein
MHLHIDQYAHLDSPIHRWAPRTKLISLFALIVGFSLVQDLRLVPFMLVITAAVFSTSRLPLPFLLSRLRYPGIFLGAMIVILPLFTGKTVILQLGFLSVQSEGVAYMLLVVSRFVAILTLSLVIFGTSTFLTTIATLRSIGIPSILADMLMLTVRYIFELADALTLMQRAMKLRGFELTRLDRRSAAQLAGLMGSLLIRSYEQAERVYKAMRLRGYGTTSDAKDTIMSQKHYLKDDTALQLSGVHFAYPSRPPVLNGVNLTIEHGERVGIIGPNGAGKTSLFLSTCGVLKPDKGSVNAYGQEIQSGKFHPAIGLVFQNSDDQLFSPTVREDIAFGPMNIGLEDAEIKQRVDEALRLTGTSHLADRAPHHLSGGEKRMVSIAAVLAMRPGLVLYDEPDANLDMRARRRLIQFLQNAPHTVMVASHDLEMILEVCNRVILLDQGRIVAEGHPAEIMGNVALMEAHGLEKPHSLVPHAHQAARMYSRVGLVVNA